MRWVTPWLVLVVFSSCATFAEDDYVIVKPASDAGGISGEGNLAGGAGAPGDGAGVTGGTGSDDKNSDAKTTSTIARPVGESTAESSSTGTDMVAGHGGASSVTTAATETTAGNTTSASTGSAAAASVSASASTGSGGATASADGSSSGSGGMPTGAASGGEVVPACGESTWPSAEQCPSVCTGGCVAGTCLILCDEKDECKQSAILCPVGLDCSVSCVGNASCAEASVHCAAGHECDTLCAANDACKKASVWCGAGVCRLHCLHEKGCEDSQLTCGKGACELTCTDLDKAPAMDCGDACHCSSNGCDAEEDD